MRNLGKGEEWEEGRMVSDYEVSSSGDVCTAEPLHSYAQMPQFTTLVTLDQIKHWFEGYMREVTNQITSKLHLLHLEVVLGAS